MKPTPPAIIALVFAALSLACPPPPADAQNDPFGPDPSQTNRRATDSEGDQATQKQASRPVAATSLRDARFDLEFIDTPVSEACEFIASQMIEIGAVPLNIVVSKDAADIVLPSMQLRQITFEQVVSFINRIGGGNLHEGGEDPFAGGEGGGGFPPHGGQRFGIIDNDGIWYFWADRKPPAAGGGNGGDRPGGGAPGNRQMEMIDQGGAAQIDTRVYPLDGEVEPTLGLIEEALAETRRHMERPEPSLKFHEPSSTLIVTGSMADLSMIEQVISVMEIRSSQQREQEERSEANLGRQQIEAMQRELHAQVELMQRELETQMRSAEDEKQRLLIQAEREVAQLEAQLAEMSSKYAATHPRILQLEAELAKALEAQKDAK